MKRISLTELVDEVSKLSGVQKNETRIIIEILFSTIKKHLLQGNSVLIWRFGVFKCKNNRARNVHNVNSNKIVTKPENISPKLEFSRSFRDLF